MTGKEHEGPPQGSEQELEEAMAEVLRVWSEDHHAAVIEGEQQATEEDVELALQTFNRLAGGSRDWGRYRWLAAAAALLLAVAGYLAWTPPDTPQTPVLLGSGDFEQLWPAGEVESYDRFSWKAGDKGELFGLRVWNVGEVDAVLRVDGLEGMTYEPTPAERQLLGSRIRWQVLLQTAEGRTLGMGSAEASLREP